jgi:RNase P subunit RPR2
MKLVVKKIYCPNCQKLVNGQEQMVNGQVRVLCSRCERLLRFWDGVVWKHVRESSL